MDDWIAHDWVLARIGSREYCVRCGLTRTEDNHDGVCATRLASPAPAVDFTKPVPDELGEALEQAYRHCRLARDMTVRERFAMAAMQGLLSDRPVTLKIEQHAEQAVALADALLDALKEADRAA